MNTDKPSQLAIVPKNKTVAVLLAVFLSYITWIYTYTEDKTKFWIAAIPLFVLGILVLPESIYILQNFEQYISDNPPDTPWSDRLSPISNLLLFGFWIWSIIDASARPLSWYQNYARKPLNKTTAVILAFLFGTIAWLYTYEKDKKKFIGTLIAMLSLIIVGVVLLMLFAFFYETWIPILLIILAGLIASASLGIWIWVIVDPIRRSGEWYHYYPNTAKPINAGFWTRTK